MKKHVITLRASVITAIAAAASNLSSMMDNNSSFRWRGCRYD